MAESNITILDLSLDALASIGNKLSDADLTSVSLACRSLNQQIMHNHSLWSCKYHKRWGNTSQQVSAVHNWPGLYSASCLATSQLSTKHPLCVEVARSHTTEPPATAQLLISSTTDDFDGETICLAASLDQKLLWWRVDGSSTAVKEQLASEEAKDTLPAAVAAVAAPAGASLLRSNLVHRKQQAALSCKLCSDLQHGHTAFVDALVEVAAGNSTGYASGSRDKTIKLWAPFSSSSATSSGCIRPVRTLRGHTGSITALLVLPARGLCSCCDHTRSSDSMHGSAPPLLASASADKTIKIWSLTALGPTGTNTGCYSSQAGHDVGEQTAGDDTESCSSTDRSQLGGKLSKSGKAARQQGHNPLLATLRGHSDCVTDLMLEPAVRSWAPSKQDGSSLCTGACKLLSCGRDCRVKMWDVNSSSCIATWRLPSPCNKLLRGFGVCNGCIAAAGPNAIMILDTRVKGSSSTSIAGVLRIPWPSGPLACASACGSLLAGGGRKGVRVWDVRAVPQATGSCNNGGAGGSCSSSQRARADAGKAACCVARASISSASSSSSSGGGGSGDSMFSSRLLFSSNMPNNEPVSAIDVNRVRLVAATDKVVLHSPASLAVWSMPNGRNLQRLSSTKSAINIQAAGNILWRDDARVNDAWELMQALSEPEAEEAFRLMYEQQQQQQQQEAQQEDDQLHSLHAAVAAVEPSGANAAQAGSYSEDSSAESDSNEGEESAVHGNSDGWDAESADTGAVTSCCYGRVEPGVVAMAAHRHVLAAIDTLGNILLRDFSKGQPRRKHMLPYCAWTEVVATSASSNIVCSSTSNAVTSSGDSNNGFNRSQAPSRSLYQNNEVEERTAAVLATAAAAMGPEALRPSKFWRS